MEEEQEVVVEWGKRITRAATKEGHLYSSVTVNGCAVDLYDCVHCWAEPDPFVAKVLKLREKEDEKDKFCGKDQVQLMYFWRPYDIEGNGGEVPTDVGPNEVFLVVPTKSKDVINFNPIEVIAQKIKVVCTSTDPRNPAPTAADVEAADFVFHRIYNHKTHAITTDMNAAIRHYARFGPYPERIVMNKPSWVTPPTRAEPTRVDRLKAELTKAEPISVEPTRAEPTGVEPTAAELTAAEPTAAEPTRAEPTRAEPVRAKPKRAEPMKAGPLRSEATWHAESTGPVRNKDSTNEEPRVHQAVGEPEAQAPADAETLATGAEEPGLEATQDMSKPAAVPEPAPSRTHSGSGGERGAGGGAAAAQGYASGGSTRGTVLSGASPEDSVPAHAGCANSLANSYPTNSIGAGRRNSCALSSAPVMDVVDNVEQAVGREAQGGGVTAPESDPVTDAQHRGSVDFAEGDAGAELERGPMAAASTSGRTLREGERELESSKDPAVHPKPLAPITPPADRQIPKWEETIAGAVRQGRVLQLEGFQPGVLHREVHDALSRVVSGVQQVRVRPWSVPVDPTAFPAASVSAYAIFWTTSAAVQAEQDFATKRFIASPGCRPIIARTVQPHDVASGGKMFTWDARPAGDNETVRHTMSLGLGHIIRRSRAAGSHAEDMRTALATTHAAQPNTVEFGLALDWRVRQEQDSQLFQELLTTHHHGMQVAQKGKKPTREAFRQAAHGTKRVLGNGTTE